MADKNVKKANPNDDITAGNNFIVEMMKKRGVVPGKAPKTKLTTPAPKKK